MTAVDASVAPPATAVFMPAATRPARVPVDLATATPLADPLPLAEPLPPAPPADDAPEGYVVFAVGSTSFAVPVDQVRSVLRTDRLDLLPAAPAPGLGRGVALVEVRGRAIPVIDLRTDTGVEGDVLLPLYRHQVGLVVDRVVAVNAAHELVPEPDGMPDVLPAYVRGVLHPMDGGSHVLLVSLPDAAALAR